MSDQSSRPNETLKELWHAVEQGHEDYVYAIAPPPNWLKNCFADLSSTEVTDLAGVFLLSGVAIAKLNKHQKLGDVARLSALLTSVLQGEKIEARAAKHPRSIEVFVQFDDRFWLVAFKLTAIYEIVVSSAYRVDKRRIQKSRDRQLLFGKLLEF